MQRQSRAAVTGAPILRRAILIAFACLLMGSSRATLSAAASLSLALTTLTELRGYLLGRKPDLDQFKARGPFAVTITKNRELRLSGTERFNADLFVSAPVERAPLVILLHGQNGSKDDHTDQAMHLASWGMHCLALQMPNTGHWIRNGKVLAKLVQAIHSSPQMIDHRIDVNRILLVGHSFGATAVSIALAERAPAAGALLLDPAAIGWKLPEYLRRVKAPVIVLGADEELFEARNRDYFFRYIPKGIGEVSIKGATHHDAEVPSDSARVVPGELATGNEMQVTFVSALTSAALSLSFTGSFDYAWASFAEGLAEGRFVDDRRK